LSFVSIKCPVCNNSNFNVFKEVFDDRYGEPNKYNLAKCSNCSHISTYPRLQLKELGPLYSKYYPRKDINYKDVLAKVKLRKNIFSKFLTWFQGVNNLGQLYAKKDEHVLDIGCGDCSSLIYLRKLGAIPYGIEEDKNVKSIAKSLDLPVHFGSIEDKPFSKVFFDLVVMNQVLEHMPSPAKTLNLIKERLTENGRIIIVIPNSESFWQKITGSKWINWHIPYHLHHFNQRNIEKMLNKYHFKIIKSQTITPNIWTILQIRNIFHKSKIGEINNLWKTKEIKNVQKEFIPYKRKYFRFFIKLILFSFIGIFNRIIDALRMGDSLMIEVKIRN